MNRSYPFLQRLDLDGEADTRAIRRAYARELKQVDQEADPQGFQYLRDCYEAALAWAASTAASAPAQQHAIEQEHEHEQARAPTATAQATSHDRPRSPAPPHFGAGWPSGVPVAPAPAPQPVLSQAAVGRLVFDLFRTRFPALGRLAWGDQEAAWRAALKSALADERLLNFDARLGFEQQLAQCLAGGWRKGHEVLLPVAAGVLGWDSDRRTLERLGEAGRLIDLALEERMGFTAQAAEIRTRQRDVLALLRAEHLPDRTRLLDAAPLMEQLMARFPHWLPLIAPMATVGAWRSAGRSVGDRVFQVAGSADAAAPAKQTPGAVGAVLGFVKWAAGCLFFLLVLGSAFGVFRDSGSRRAEGKSAQAYRERLRNPPPLWKDEPVPQAKLEDISARIKYRPGKRVKPGVQRASFQVFLDENGKVIGANRKEGAADPAYTEAVEKAIMATAPFPPHTVKIFTVAFSATLKRVSRPVEPPPDWTRRRLGDAGGDRGAAPRFGPGPVQAQDRDAVERAAAPAPEHPDGPAAQ